MMSLAYHAGRLGGTSPTVFNAANEVAVNRFLTGEIPFIAIERIVEETLTEHHQIDNPGLNIIWEIDEWARMTAKRK